MKPQKMPVLISKVHQLTFELNSAEQEYKLVHDINCEYVDLNHEIIFLEGEVTHHEAPFVFFSPKITNNYHKFITFKVIPRDPRTNQEFNMGQTELETKYRKNCMYIIMAKMYSMQEPSFSYMSYTYLYKRFADSNNEGRFISVHYETERPRE